MQVLKQFGLLGVLMLGSATAVLADGMTVEPGDVLRVTVAEAPDIGRDSVKVDADGRIMLPVVGGDRRRRRATSTPSAARSPTASSPPT